MKKAFILMPFRAPYNSYYYKIYKPALESVGYSVIRVDELFGSHPIIDDIQKSIKESDLILCDMSTRNPNVFYELGLAHAIGKPVILVSNNIDDIPFDLKHIRTIIYKTDEAGWEGELYKSIANYGAEKNLRIYPEPLIASFGTGQVSAKNFFQTRADRPPMEIRLRNAKTVDFIGTSLIGLAVTNQSELRTLRDAGAKIRLIISNPDNEPLQEFLAMRYLEADSAKHHKDQVSVALSNFKSIIGASPNRGSVEVRITNLMQSFSYMGIDTSFPQGYIQIELYLNKVALSRNPIFLLYADSDTQWFNEFGEQFEFYWTNSFDPYGK